MSQFEQFAHDELQILREELRQSGLDSFQAAACITSFLAAKGYGVSPDAARDAVAVIDAPGFTLPRLQLELEKLAYVM